MCEDPEPRRTGKAGCKDQPLARLAWIARKKLRPNSWNPNHVAPPELDLLRLSLLEDGWTQPIVAFQLQAGGLEIIDGEHRWTLSGEPAIFAMTGGLVPVVVLTDAIELVMAAEMEFDIEIPDDDAEKLTTVGAAIDYLAERVKAKKE